MSKQATRQNKRSKITFDNGVDFAEGLDPTSKNVIRDGS
jgi:hypothetical protein